MALLAASADEALAVLVRSLREIAGRNRASAWTAFSSPSPRRCRPSPAPAPDAEAEPGRAIAMDVASLQLRNRLGRERTIDDITDPTLRTDVMGVVRGRCSRCGEDDVDGIRHVDSVVV